MHNGNSYPGGWIHGASRNCVVIPLPVPRKWAFRGRCLPQKPDYWTVSTYLLKQRSVTNRWWMRITIPRPSTPAIRQIVLGTLQTEGLLISPQHNAQPISDGRKLGGGYQNSSQSPKLQSIIGRPQLRSLIDHQWSHYPDLHGNTNNWRNPQQPEVYVALWHCFSTFFMPQPPLYPKYPPLYLLCY